MSAPGPPLSAHASLPVPSEHATLIGILLGNRYRIDGELGRGGMGSVYRAHDTLLGRDVAVKMLAADSLDPRARERLLREARSVAALAHPGIVVVHDAGEAAGTSYIVM